MNVPMSRWFMAAFCAIVLASPASAANPPPTQLFYVPFPEDNQLAGFLSITTGNGTTQATDPLAIFVTFSAATDNTVIYYDHWEDGYEKDITNPVQSTTAIFGDGNPSNGYPPGNANDLIPAGTVFSLRNYVTSTNLTALDYDARDKVASFKPISLTKTSFPASTNTLLAGCVEVFEQGLWGTEYRVPIGVDMPTTTATATLAPDTDIFGYTALSIMAGAKGASVQIDADNNGAFEQTVTLSEGETTYVTGVNTGGTGAVRQTRASHSVHRPPGFEIPEPGHLVAADLPLEHQLLRSGLHLHQLRDLRVSLQPGHQRHHGEL